MSERLDNVRRAYAGEILTPGGRLTLATLTPVTVADQLAKTTIYYSPYVSDVIPIYDGEHWIGWRFSELSVAVPNTTVKPFDVFVYDNAGVLTLVTTDWTNDTTRAVALTMLNGRLVKSGTPTQLYLGTGRTTGAAGQCEDSVAKRFLANWYNVVQRKLLKETVGSHAYNAAAWRAWNNDATTIFEFVTPVQRDPVLVSMNAGITASVAGSVGYASAELDATTTITALNNSIANGNTGQVNGVVAGVIAPPAAGYHYVCTVEFGNANAVTFATSRMHGYCMG